MTNKNNKNADSTVSTVFAFAVVLTAMLLVVDIGVFAPTIYYFITDGMSTKTLFSLMGAVYILAGEAGSATLAVLLLYLKEKEGL
jgi:hypothetical protein